MTEKTITVNGKPTETSLATIDHTGAAKLAMGSKWRSKNKYAVICYTPATGCGQALDPDTPSVDLEEGMELQVAKRRW